MVFVGAGALGGYVGGNLARLGHDVTFVDPWPEHVEIIRRDGLELDGLTAEEKFTVKNLKIFHITEEADYGSVTEVIEVADDDYFVLMPGETAHGITRERIHLPDHLCGWLQGRSRFARVGLTVHITASFMQPGIDNRQALEMNNSGPMPLAVRPGIAICQFIFEECTGRARYSGRYLEQAAP